MTFTVNGHEVSARNMSEGVLRYLGLLVMLQNPPDLLLLDDVERGLHPRTQIALVEFLKETQDSTALQVIATTHSADLLDSCTAEQIRLLSLNSSGSAQCVGMHEHPSYAGWRALMTPSELWAEMDRETGT